MTCCRFKPLLGVVLASQFATFAAQALQANVYVSRPPGCVKFVYPLYPPSLAVTGVSGKGAFLLKVNPKTGDVDEVKVIKSCGYSLLNEFAAKAFFQWKFQPGVVTSVKIPVEFMTSGYARDLH